MAAAHSSIQPGKFVVSRKLRMIYSVFMFVGLLVFGAGLYSDQHRIWFAFLVSFFFFVNLGLGGLFFTAIQHATNAGWSVNLRRIFESFTAYLPYAAISALVLLFGARKIYEWLDPEIVKNDSILLGKSAYLNGTFFAIRLVVFFAIWLIFSRFLVKNSILQDKDGNEKFTHKNAALGVAFLVLFALSYSLFSVDVLMSLQPHWFSTMFGIYCFAGLFQASLAAFTIVIVYSMNKGWLNGLVTEHHLHDMGKFLKAFTVFYAYIAFSQFMLIWYANLPEETIFYLNRHDGGWMAISMSLLIFKFVVPFLLLLPKAAKRAPSHLVLVSILILIMEYVDIYWMVYPNLHGHGAEGTAAILFSWQEIGMFLGFAGLFIWAVTNFLAQNNLVPVKDPRIEESIHHHVTY